MCLVNVSAVMDILVLTVKLVSLIPILHTHTFYTIIPDLIPCQRGNPCSNGTLCTNDGFGGYICHCSLGYTGMECDQEINECDPNPCYNGSTCIVSYLSGHHSTVSCYKFNLLQDEVGGYNCVCPEGLEGDLCHLDM